MNEQPYESAYRCIKCGIRSDIETFRYTCPSCSGNLMVEYDYEAIATNWSLDRLRADTDPSMWRYSPLLPVRGKLTQLPVGPTPLMEAPRLAARAGVARLMIKDDGRNPSASFKDRASAVALVKAQELGFDMVTGASTGNAASATAVLAAAMGMKARIFVPARAPEAKVAQLLTFGAEVLSVEGSYDDAFDLCLAATDRFGWYNRNTGFNPFTREGKKTVSFEICEQMQMEVPDVVVVPVGDGNILTGVWKGFVEFHRLGFITRLPRLLAVQANGSASIVNAFRGDGEIRPVSGETVADSISVSIPRDGDAAVAAIRESGGTGVLVDDDQILAAIAEVARHSGVFCEPAAAAGYAGLKQAIQEGLVGGEASFLLLVTGNGLKDVGSAMKVSGKPRTIRPDPAVLDELFGEESRRLAAVDK